MADDTLARKLGKSVCFELETVDGYTNEEVLNAIAFAAVAGATFLAEAQETSGLEANYLRLQLAEFVMEIVKARNESN